MWKRAVYIYYVIVTDCNFMYIKLCVAKQIWFENVNRLGYGNLLYCVRSLIGRASNVIIVVVIMTVIIITDESRSAADAADADHTLWTQCISTEWAILAFDELIIHTAMFTDINVVHDVCNVVLNGQRKRNRNQFCTEWTVFSNVVVMYEMKSVLRRLINSTYNASEWRCQLQNFGFMYLLML